jgi:hypothetical protein
MIRVITLPSHQMIDICLKMPLKITRILPITSNKFFCIQSTQDTLVSRDYPFMRFWVSVIFARELGACIVIS